MTCITKRSWPGAVDEKNLSCWQHREKQRVVLLQGTFNEKPTGGKS